MSISNNLDIRLKIGNLLLAILLSTVPTAMTIGFLRINGLLICNNLRSSIIVDNKTKIIEKCYNSNKQISYEYLIFYLLNEQFLSQLNLLLLQILQILPFQPTYEYLKVFMRLSVHDVDEKIFM